jgi:ATP-dependent Clp protease adaptor protein ClpS
MAMVARWLFASRNTGRAAAPNGRIEPVAAREPRKGPEGPGSGAAVITRTRTQTKRPNMYRVLLLNDDYTPMEFVIMGECGVFTYEIAETKVAQVMDHARKNQHPLQCIMEKK